MTERIVIKEEESTSEVLTEGEKAGQPPAIVSKQDTQPILSMLTASQLLNDYNLDEKDVGIIALLFNSLMNGKDGVRVTDILKHIEKNISTAFREMGRIEKLKHLGIIEAAGRHSGSIAENIGVLLRSSVQLSDKFISSIYSKNSEQNIDIKEAYKDNLEYLSDQFERVRILKEINGFDFPRKIRGSRGAMADKNVVEELNKLEKRIEKKLGRNERTFPFEEFKKKTKLNRKEELIVIALLENEITCGGEYDADKIIDIISPTSYERLADRALLQEGGKLIKKKILETGSTSRMFPIGRRMESIRLNNNLKVNLLEEKKKQRKEKFKGDSFFEIIKPSVPFDKVILHPKTSEELNIAIEKIEGGTANLLHEWGIKSNLLNTESGKRIRQTALMLFYGPPGTGKTLAANAIAHRLKREMITFDCSKILSKWVGESEQNTRKIFDKYKEMSSGMKNHPVLLLNEADQFLHRRINAIRSTDHMYNQMQNIFLEQLEKFEGVLIATTNLIENLDSAFSRRFHHKIEFRRPGPEERLKLWRIHIPEKTPLSDDVNLQHLAEHYDLSGGQIAVVVQNAAARAVRRGNKEISLDDFITACNEEMRGNFDERAKVKVGF